MSFEFVFGNLNLDIRVGGTAHRFSIQGHLVGKRMAEQVGQLSIHGGELEWSQSALVEEPSEKRPVATPLHDKFYGIVAPSIEFQKR